MVNQVIAWKVVDKRHHAQGNQGGGRKSGLFARKDEGSEKQKSASASDFGFGRGRILRRHYRRLENGEWERLLDIPRAEEEALEKRKGWPNGPILPPHNTRGNVPTSKGARKSSKNKGGRGSGKSAAALDEDTEAEESFSGGGPDPAELDEDYIAGLPCMRDEREGRFGIGLDEMEERKQVKKDGRNAPD